MNEKFFDLKKEKQDRMINAALKIFAQNGYGHASTDDIVKEAGISKGLLFHYFISKLGLYSFIYDYSVRYLILELTTGIDKNETDYFTLMQQVKFAELQVMRTYPYLPLFLKQSRAEEVGEALMETEDKRNMVPDRIREILDKADTTKFKKNVDISLLTNMITYTADGLMKERIAEKSFSPEQYFDELKQYFLFLRKITCE